MTMMTLERSRVIDATVAQLWEIISDLDGFHRHTTTLSETTVIAGADLGARRRCVDSSGGAWEETCTVWVPLKEYVVDVDVSTYPAKYRAIFRTFTGTWRVEPVDRGTRVTIRFDAELRRVPGLAKLVARHSERSLSDLDAILDSYTSTAQRVSSTGLESG
jgi:ribosome-associated toxin RatA of RatAB toxin-antitoxin module